MAMKSPVTIVPTSTPPSTTLPSAGMAATSDHRDDREQRGHDPSRVSAALVTMSTQVPYSGVSSPCKMPGFAWSWRRTSSDDRARGFADRVHAERGKHKRQQAADEKSDDHLRIAERKGQKPLNRVRSAAWIGCRVRRRVEPYATAPEDAL